MPLETPTVLELSPHLKIQVTLFDANHCPGAVMFLIERGDTAILYTGDIRSEPWFVNSIARHPALIEYTCGIRRLNKIYLDTSFTEDIPFQTKQQGIAELLRKVALYPEDTVFYFQTWTYGYEDVWLALSKALKSRIHVDDYKLGIYNSLSAKNTDNRFAADSHCTPLAPSLTGYMCGNSRHPGCLTSDESVRLHSCEKGNLCSVASRPNVVKIQPIVAHLADGTDIAEAGVGGGGNDFRRDAELGFLSSYDMQALQEILSSSFDDTEGLMKTLFQAAGSGRDVHLGLGIDIFSDEFTTDIKNFFETLIQERKSSSGSTTPRDGGLPSVIRFPYARHSSYEELCHFVDTFKPLDVWPCTEDAEYWWRHGHSIASYFGEYCFGTDFSYDTMLQSLYPEPPPREEDRQDTQTSGLASLGTREQPSSPLRRSFSENPDPPVAEEAMHPSPKRARLDGEAQGESQQSMASHIAETDSATRWEAYNRTLNGLYDGDWGPLPLLSTTDHHSKVEKEL
ncbi:hypothetical protein NLG97_g5016 [Lecanicillium saksenae]|uniref:Uncharacterized protein n=1 Tax=Lecanicillium saksenae TaxID=468837 RepID=A0ACC1QTT6_9HYPO|nr:hypothetical protein NLG97_g5016 [Lecanicillium saksenae]